MSELLTIEKIGGAGSRDRASIDANVERMAGNDALWGAVVSGPGGPAGRATELALGVIEDFARDAPVEPGLDEIRERLHAHAEEHGQTAVRIAEKTVADMHDGLHDGRGSGWMTMGPERYAAGLYAWRLTEAGRQAVVFDPTPWIRRDGRGAIDLNLATRGLRRQYRGLNPDAVVVMPGSPGVDQFGRVVPVTPALRGYSDVAGMVAAHALQEHLGGAVTYRIIKDDVPGILRMAPGLGIPKEELAVAPRLSVLEASRLTAGGSGVVQSGVLDLLQYSDVRLQVSSGEATDTGGTVIERRRALDAGERIAGIAVQEAVSYTVSDIRMEHQAGVAGDIIRTFGEHDVPLINVITGDGVVQALVGLTHHRAVHDALPGLFEQQYGSNFALVGDNRHDRDAFSIVTLVGEAMAGQEGFNRRMEVQHDAGVIIPQSANGLPQPHPEKVWASPGGNAVYVTIPSGDIANYASAAYRHFFETATD